MNNAKGIGRIADFIQSFFSAGVGSNGDVIGKNSQRTNQQATILSTPAAK